MKKAVSTLTVLLITALLALLVSMTALLSTVPVAGATYTEKVKLYPNNDAYVDQENPDNNYGTYQKLIMDNIGNKKYSYLKFDISTIPSGMTITSANLYLWCDAREGGGYYRIYAYSVENDNWNETTITWDNRPDAVTFLSENSEDTLAWWNWDVKAFVENEYGSDNTVSLCLIPGDGNEFITEFRSREWWPPDYKPYLEVTYVPLPATIDIDPDTLNLKSNGNWITAYIEFSGQDVNEIVIGSIKLIAAGKEFTVDPAAPTAIGDYDSDGIPDLMVKFDRADIVAWLNVGDVDSEEAGIADGLELKITGEVAGFYFEGSDTIKVIGTRKK